MSTTHDSSVNLWCPLCGTKGAYYPRGEPRVPCVNCGKPFRVADGHSPGKAAKKLEAETNGRIHDIEEHLKRVEAGHEKLEADHEKEKYRNRMYWRAVIAAAGFVLSSIGLKLIDLLFK